MCDSDEEYYRADSSHSSYSHSSNYDWSSAGYKLDALTNPKKQNKANVTSYVKFNKKKSYEPVSQSNQQANRLKKIIGSIADKLNQMDSETVNNKRNKTEPISNFEIGEEATTWSPSDYIPPLKLGGQDAYTEVSSSGYPRASPKSIQKTSSFGSNFQCPPQPQLNFRQKRSPQPSPTALNGSVRESSTSPRFNSFSNQKAQKPVPPKLMAIKTVHSRNNSQTSTTRNREEEFAVIVESLQQQIAIRDEEISMLRERNRTERSIMNKKIKELKLQNTAMRQYGDRCTALEEKYKALLTSAYQENQYEASRNSKRNSKTSSNVTCEDYKHSATSRAKAQAMLVVAEQQKAQYEQVIFQLHNQNRLFKNILEQENLLHKPSHRQNAQRLKKIMEGLREVATLRNEF